MFTILCTLLTTTVLAGGCGCHAKTSDIAQDTRDRKEDQQEINMVIPVSIKCKDFRALSAESRKANKTIAMAYHHDDVANGRKAKRIFISHATITIDDKQTTLHFFVSKRADKKEVEERVRVGFEKLCAEEKIHLAKPEKEREKIKCWFCHKYDAYAKWVKTEWKKLSGYEGNKKSSVSSSKPPQN